jgi:hypothetical protein
MKNVVIIIVFLLCFTMVEAQTPLPVSPQSISISQISTFMNAIGEDNTNSKSLLFLGGKSHLPKTNPTRPPYKLTDWYGYGPVAFTTCGALFIVTHTAASSGAPVTKIVNYGTVTSSLSGASKCWITQDLGANYQGTSATDASDASVGWYWQFNLTQGYSNIASVTYPAWTNTSYSISDNNNWLLQNDPCAIQLGIGWRLPTSSEWGNVFSSLGGSGYPSIAWNSPLKLHEGGTLSPSNGIKSVIGSYNSGGTWWSSTQDFRNSYFGFIASWQGTYNSTGGEIDKATGINVRCLRNWQ